MYDFAESDGGPAGVFEYQRIVTRYVTASIKSVIETVTPHNRLYAKGEDWPAGVSGRQGLRRITTLSGCMIMIIMI